MKIKKVLKLVVFGIFILLISNNVYAQTIKYNTYYCDGKYWSPGHSCAGLDNTQEYFAVLTLDYVGDTISITEIQAGAFNKDDDNALQYLEKDEKQSVYDATNGDFDYVYDLTLLEKYYKKTHTVPKEFVVSSYQTSGGEVFNNRSLQNTRYFKFSISEWEIIRNDSTETYFSMDNELNKESLVCSDLDEFKKELEASVKLYGSNSEDAKYYVDVMETKCDNYLAFNKDTKVGCYSECLDIRKYLSNLGIDAYNSTNSCGIGERMIAWLVRILKLLRFIVPILVIVLSTFEYVSAFMSNDDDAFKKAGGRFGKRLFIMILFFTLPSILQFVFNVFNVDGLSSSNPYCLKWK